ncbi:hypothetical protein RF11_13430 [Thelohanellus kitauei]|uniref:Uncharacterized protein n=1 Tax=Thelohanellus kitauei TaxID=669202 RepID=A0A0C2NFY4_THEKT|nr:hypothetical protein RF11_13430 [Thelohanellus kitauei]
MLSTLNLVFAFSAIVLASQEHVVHGAQGVIPKNGVPSPRKAETNENGAAKHQSSSDQTIRSSSKDVSNQKALGDNESVESHRVSRTYGRDIGKNIAPRTYIPPPSPPSPPTIEYIGDATDCDDAVYPEACKETLRRRREEALKIYSQNYSPSRTRGG